MNKLIDFIKKNWLVFAVVILFFVFGQKTNQVNLLSTKESSTYDYAPSTGRMVSLATSLNILVKDVPKTIKEIQSQSEKLGGFMVNSSQNNPSSAATGQIQVRIPQDKLSEALESFKKLSVKTISESVTGHDVTDQYQDLEAKLKVLTTTKSKFESIMSSAVKVSDLLEVQRELINLQSQIDQVKGQQQYLDKTTSFSLVSVQLSTDELALPYAPDSAWRPMVIVKESIRSLILVFRFIFNTLIRIIIFTPVWLPLWLIYKIFRKKF
ncbi:MAG TPA: DUF4349 domain-containing protein [Candidatus Woesebacteria bacterium]|nr:DUF4349 domain-containing protein [Candidatus Woesebacteria bacterium]HPJ16704.1 DUF4349 domain-containing protein [Candidatus Woesebacteria bacterium]